jgi:RHH-type transcriptional regulator, rel operon repressor / antitoxin RelB
MRYLKYKYLKYYEELPMAISVCLNPEIEQRLEHLASQTGRAKSDYLRELIEGGLDDLEDFYFADAAMERIRKGQETIFEASDVRESLQL